MELFNNGNVRKSESKYERMVGRSKSPSNVGMDEQGEENPLRGGKRIQSIFE